MPTISLTVPTELIDALCAIHDYQELVPVTAGDPPVTTMEPNPESRGAFAKRMVVERLKSTVRDYRRNRAVTTVNTQADADIT